MKAAKVPLLHRSMRAARWRSSLWKKASGKGMRVALAAAMVEVAGGRGKGAVGITPVAATLTGPSGDGRSRDVDVSRARLVCPAAICCSLSSRRLTPTASSLRLRTCGAMPGHSTRAPSKSRSHPRSADHRQEAPRPRKAPGRLSPDRRESETLGFVPGSAEAASPAEAPACGLCGSLGGWSGCAALVCCVLTCGLYGAPEPCAGAPESSTDPSPGSSPAKRADPEANGLDSAPRPGKLPASDSFRYRDVCFRGQKVEYAEVRGGGGASRRYRPPGGPAAGSKGESQRPVSNTSVYSREDLDLDDLNDGDTDIDALITRKLLELYKLHQIEQLAQCTSDSSFSRRTNEISDLINSIAQDYNLQEQEAECRLVQGVIRISTRKSKRPGHAHRDKELSGRRDKTLPDSGHETMPDSFGSSETEPEVKVSEQTSSDELARKMRLQSGRGSSYSSPYQHEMETVSSGTPLLHFVKP